MKKRFKEEQIIQILREAETAENNPEVCRKYGICQQTLYRWKRKYDGLEVSDLRQLKSVQGENRRLKRLVADQALAIQAMQEVLAKKGLR